MKPYKISLSAVNVPPETYPMMQEALSKGKIGQTDLIDEFEESVARYVGAKYCIAICNGTMADAVAVAAMHQLEGNRDKKRVIVPALTFIAQPNSVLYNGLEVVFSDVNEDWTLNLDGIEYALKDHLVFATDLMGRMAVCYADIIDSCEAFGSRFGDHFAGTTAGLGTYSFFPSHTISTGEGGMIVTNDIILASLCRSIRSHGASSREPMDKFHFPYFGFNARMSSLNAVLGICLMKHVREYVENRHVIFSYMRSKLGGFKERMSERIIPHGYPVEFDSQAHRDQAMLNILEAGIECRKFFSCIPLEEPVYLRRDSFPVAQHIANTHLYLPCHQNMSEEDVDYACNVVQEQRGLVRQSVNKDCACGQGEGQGEPNCCMRQEQIEASPE